jgi:deoxyribonuclease IV
VLELGAHMSISGGHHMAIDRALASQMSAFQLFTKNQRQWKASPIDPAAAETFRTCWGGCGMKHLVAHDSYLINIGSPDDELWQKSRAALQDELERCDLLGVPYLVSHPGAHVNSGLEAGIARIAEAIDRIHEALPDGRAAILLETTAGQGTTIGRTFEELAAIIDKVADKQRVGVCFDTCHVFAAGYELRTPEGYAETMRVFDRTVGLDRIKAFHLNDSKHPLGSRKDRHEHIGEGELGLDGFRHLLNDPRFAGLPGIMETPKDADDDGNDVRNLAALRALVAAA